MASERTGRGGAGRRLAAAALLLAAGPLLLGARVYHSEAEALDIAYPEATELVEKVHVLDDAARTRVAERAGTPARKHLVTFHEARREGDLLGRAVLLEEKGKSLPFRFLVAIRPDGSVDQVLLLSYREPQGEEIRRESFRRQYRGKSLADPIRRGRDIRNITGATISVDSLSRGVRRALALHAVLVGEAGAEPRQASAEPPAESGG